METGCLATAYYKASGSFGLTSAWPLFLNFTSEELY